MSENTEPFLKVGDLVTTKYLGVDIQVIRKITSVVPDKTMESGFRVCADGGRKCRCCGKTLARPVLDIDMGWFTKVPEPKPEDMDNPFEFLR